MKLLDSIWAVIGASSDDEEDGEGIIAINQGGDWYPLVTHNPKRVIALGELALQFAERTGRPVTLVRMSHRTDIQVFRPSPSSDPASN